MHPDRALKRRNLVINALLEDGKITARQATDAKALPLHLNVEHDPNSLAPYYVEEIRRYLETRYGSDQVHQGGLRVYTSLDMDLQRAANRAVLNGVAAYERRQKWRGNLANIASHRQQIDKYEDPDWDQQPEVNGYIHALVTAISPTTVQIRFGERTATLSQAEVAW